MLSEKGKPPDEFFSLKMINNTPKGVAPKFLMRLNWEEEITDALQNELQKDIEKELVRIKDGLNEKSSHFHQNIKTDRTLRASFFDRMLWGFSSGQSPKLNFLLDEGCTGCGTCERVCLSGRIKMSDGRPIWREETECFYCYACFNFCPEQSIGVKHYTKKMGRYHHPEISLEEIVGQTKQPDTDQST